jgi:hypothetical protein
MFVCQKPLITQTEQFQEQVRSPPVIKAFSDDFIIVHNLLEQAQKPLVFAKGVAGDRPQRFIVETFAQGFKQLSVQGSHVFPI